MGPTRKDLPRIYDLHEFLTSEDDLFIQNHLGEPVVDITSWRLIISGLVERPLSLSMDELLQFQRVEVTAFHKCAGSPFYPLNPTPDEVGNVVWSGIRLVDILRKVNPQAAATFVWSSGEDFGSFRGAESQPYSKDLPLGRALKPEVLLATHLNGRPLTTRRGGPVRLVVPGYYGTNSVKWLFSLQLAAKRSAGIFTTKYYNDEIHKADGTTVTLPVWAVAPDSAIVSPRSNAILSRQCDLVVSGWAWGDQEISTVHVSVDGGQTWHNAHLKPRIIYSWQAFHLSVIGLGPGQYQLLSRATNHAGQIQPLGGARNASVPVNITITD